IAMSVRRPRSCGEKALLPVDFSNAVAFVASLFKRAGVLSIGSSLAGTKPGPGELRAVVDPVHREQVCSWLKEYHKGMSALDAKRESLLGELRKLETCAVAFSGGVDSAV